MSNGEASFRGVVDALRAAQRIVEACEPSTPAMRAVASKRVLSRSSSATRSKTELRAMISAGLS